MYGYLIVCLVHAFIYAVRLDPLDMFKIVINVLF